MKRSCKMQRSMYEQALRMHGQSLALLVEENQREKFVFVDDENNEHGVGTTAFNERQPTAIEPDVVPPTLPHGAGRLTGTLRDLVQPHIDSNPEDSRSDVSPDILPLGVPRELHEPFELESSKVARSQRSAANKRDEFASRLQEFIAKKADLLFKVPNTGDDPDSSPHIQDTEDLDYYAILPPMEQFMGVPLDQARKRLFEFLKVGDILAGSIIAIKEFGMFVRVIFVCGKESRYIENCDVVGLLPKGELGERFSQKARLDDFHVRDLIRGVVMKTDAANEKVILTLNSHSDDSLDVPLGIINESELPVYCRRSRTQLETRESYDDMLHNTLGFDNPNNVAYLASMLHIDDTRPPSLMQALQSSNFSEKEHAEVLRKWQSHKWSMESVARGVEHFKSSRYLEAMQQLNRALEIDTENVEGLVARGALFANQDNLSKAIKDFAEALRIKPTHKNANKYMCETLMEKGKQCEESGDTDKAIDCYQSVVDLNAELLDARTSLQRLMKATKRKYMHDDKRIDEDSVVSISDDSLPIHMSAKELRQMIDESNKSSSKKKKKKNKNKKESCDGKGDKKSRKEKKMTKRKRESRGSVSPEVKSMHMKKELLNSESSASDSDSSSRSPMPKEKKKKRHSRGDGHENSSSPELNRSVGRKRSRNESVSPERKSRSKTRKAHHMLLKKISGASTISSSEDESQYTREPSKLTRRSISQEKRGSTARKKTKRLSDESSVSSSTSPENHCSVKEIKGRRKSFKKDTDPDERNLKRDRKEAAKQTSSSQNSDESSDSIQDSPIKKKSKYVKHSSSKKRPKESEKISRKKESTDSSSSDSDSSKIENSPPAKVPKKKNKKNKKKQRRRERSVSSSSSASPTSPAPKHSKTGSPKKKKKKKHLRAQSGETSPRSRSESPKSVKKYKVSPDETKIMQQANVTSKSDMSPSHSQDRERSRSSSISSCKRDRPQDKPSGEKVRGKVDSRRRSSRSTERTEFGNQSHSGRKTSRKSGSLSPQREKQKRKQSPRRESEDEESLGRKDGQRKRKASTSSRHRSASPPVDRTDEARDGGRLTEKSDNSRVRQTRSRSPQKHIQRSLSGEKRGSEHETRRKSGESRREKLSRRSKSQSPVSEKLESRKLILTGESEGEGKRGLDVSPERMTRSSRRSRSRSPKEKKEDMSVLNTEDKEREGKSNETSGTMSPVKERHGRRSREGREIVENKRSKPDEPESQKRSLSSRSVSPSIETSGIMLPVKETHGRRSREGRELDEDKKNKEDEPETKKRDLPNRSVSPEEKTNLKTLQLQNVDSKRSMESSRDRKRSDTKQSLSPLSDKGDRSKSREERIVGRDMTEKSVNQRDRTPTYFRRSRSSEKERGDHDRRLSGPRDSERRQLSEGRGRNRSGPTEEEKRKLQDEQENEQEQRRRSSERDRRRSDEGNRWRSGEGDRRRVNDDDIKRRASTDSRSSDRGRGSRDTWDRWNDRDWRRQSFDRSNESDRRSDRREGRSRDRDVRSRDRDRRISGESKDTGRRGGLVSRDTSFEDRHMEKSQERDRERVSHEKGKSYDRKQTSDSFSLARDHLSPPVNIKDIPMPPDAEVKSDVTKEASPIKYVTSGSCKDEIIKVKSKWDTDSEDDEDDKFGSLLQKKGGIGGPSIIMNQSTQNQSSRGSSGQSGSGQGSGGYRRHGEVVHTEMQSEYLTLQECSAVVQNILEGIFVSVVPSKFSEISCSSSRVVDDDKGVSHAPLRLRGGCVSSPPKLEDDYYSGESSDLSRNTPLSDISFNSDALSTSQAANKHSRSRRKLRYHTSRSSSSSSTSSKSRKRFKHGSSTSHSRSSSSGSSRSTSSRNSFKSSSSRSSNSSDLSGSSNSSSASSTSHSSWQKVNKSSRSDKSHKNTNKLKLEHTAQNSDSGGSTSGSAGAYALWDSWEDYMDSKGHQIAKNVSNYDNDNSKQKLFVVDQQVGIVRHSDTDDEVAVNSMNKQRQSVEDTKVEENVPQVETVHGSKNKGSYKERGKVSKSTSKSPQASYSNRPKESRTSQDIGCRPEVAVDKSIDPYESQRNQDTIPLSQSDNKSRSDYHGCRDEQNNRSNVNRTSYDKYTCEYASKTEHHQLHSQERRHRGYNEQHSFHQRGRREFDHKAAYHGRRDERRSRYGRDIEWGRGVTETKERGMFFGLVSQPKNYLISLLYDVTRNLEFSSSHCLKSRTWWL